MIFILGTVLVAVASTAFANVIPQNCVCPYNYLPVCGSDDNTYPNGCTLRCAQTQSPQLKLRHMGSCQAKVKRQVYPACTCTRKLEPVCGTDGVTYNNPCLLECAAASRPELSLQYAGTCSDRVKVVEQPEIRPNPDCVCNRNKRPVCGADGNTYNNECLLRCAGASLQHSGPCVDEVKVAVPAGDCNCQRNLRPVCGSDGVTYNNECLLRCSGTSVSVARAGPC